MLDSILPRITDTLIVTDSTRRLDAESFSPYFPGTGTSGAQAFIQNPFSQLERHRGVKVAELLAEHGIDEVRTRVNLDGKGAGYILEALGIDALTADAATLREPLYEVSQDQGAFPDL